MMTKMSKSPEGLLRAGASSCLGNLLGNFPHSNNISNSVAFNADAGDLNELKEEDVWETWLERSNPAHDSAIKEEIFRHKTDGVSLALEGSRVGGVRRQQRWLGFETGGLSVAFVDSNVRSRFSPLTRTSNSFKLASPSPSRSMSVKGNGSSHMVMHQSVPVNVPDWSKIQRMEYRKANPIVFSAAGDDDDEDEDEDEDKLPPHEYLAREQARSQVATTSVFEGVGRTLKGRDMSRVRNAVWRQTGFLG